MVKRGALDGRHKSIGVDQWECCGFGCEAGIETGLASRKADTGVFFFFYSVFFEI